MVFGNFAVLPPEIISGQMYSGPGAEPLLAAASSWDGLAAELHSAASSYASVISGLTAGWQGSSSELMATAAATYLTWMSTTAAQAEETAAQAKAAAGAYEAAFVAVVPPPVITANRTQLASLVATNILGQNSAAIAATEAQYGQLWAQDVAAMFGYAAAAQSATELTPFTAPAQTTTDNGAAGQAAAAAATSQSSAATAAQSALAQLAQAVTTSPTQYTTAAQNALNTLTGSSATSGLYESFWNFQSAVGSEGTWTNAAGGSLNLGMTQVRLFHKLPGLPVIAKSALGGGLISGGLSSPVAAIGGGITAASAGTASTVGALSVPANWATATPAIRLASIGLPGALAAAPAADLAGGLLNPAALGSLTGGALGGPATRASTRGVQVMAATATKRNVPVKLDQVIAQLQQTPDTVQHWNVEESGLDDLVAKLSLKPGIHAVHVCADGETATAAPQSALG